MVVNKFMWKNFGCMLFIALKAVVRQKVCEKFPKNLFKHDHFELFRGLGISQRETFKIMHLNNVKIAENYVHYED